MLKGIVTLYLKYLTKLILAINRPRVIAIAGSVNKQFTRDEVMRVLREAGLEARANPKNFNTEIGLPLAILDLPSGYNDHKKWFRILLKTPSCLFKKLPEYLVLSLGSSDPGDMKYLLSIVKPQTVIITEITQKFIESFSDMDELVGEYERLISALPRSGTLIINNDNPRIAELAGKAGCRVITYGAKDAYILAQNITKDRQGMSFTVNGEDIQLKRYGIHHVYAYLAGEIIKRNFKQQLTNSKFK